MKRVDQIMKRLEEIGEDWNDEVAELFNELERIDPYNDLLHCGHTSFPNCDTIGCTTDEDGLIKPPIKPPY